MSLDRVDAHVWTGFVWLLVEFLMQQVTRGHTQLPESWDRKYAYESRGTRNKEWTYWRGPAAIYPTDRMEVVISGSNVVYSLVVTVFYLLSLSIHATFNS
jgi:hypothetical protein